MDRSSYLKIQRSARFPSCSSETPWNPLFHFLKNQNFKSWKRESKRSPNQTFIRRQNHLTTSAPLKESLKQSIPQEDWASQRFIYPEQRAPEDPSMWLKPHVPGETAPFLTHSLPNPILPTHFQQCSNAKMPTAASCKVGEVSSPTFIILSRGKPP